jgi:hypothetical protein
VGGTALLVFALLLGIRLGVLHKPLGDGPVTATLSPLPKDSDTWMNILQNGRKIGYANRSLTATHNGFRYREQIAMQINTMGIIQPLTVRTEADLKTDRTLEGFRFELGSNLFRFTARGVVSDKKLTLHSGTPEQETVSVVPIDQSPYLGGGILESLGLQGIREGEERSLPVFDPASLTQRPVRIAALGQEELVIGGQRRRARKLAVDFMGVKQHAWIDAGGSILREEGILGIVLEKVSRAEALAGLNGAVSADLTEAAAIPSPLRIPEPAALTELTLRLRGVATGPFHLDGGRQQFRNGLLTLRREVLAPSPETRTPKAQDLRVWLQPSPLIQSGHPQMAQAAAEIAPAADPPGAKARKIVNWVNTRLEKRPVLSVPNALETLEKRIGDCNEHAVLVTALARAAGIPADIEAGIVYLRGRFYYHAWNTLFVPEWGGWVTADAVLGQLPADVTHIRFVSGGTDRQTDLLGLIGRLEIEILEMKR